MPFMERGSRVSTATVRGVIEPSAPDAAHRPEDRSRPPRARPPAGRRRPDGIAPIREHVHQALTVLGAPALSRLIRAVHEAFGGEPLDLPRPAVVRREERRAFADGPARPYYLCAALCHDRLAPARGLLAPSVWPVERRVVTPYSPRMDALTQVLGVAGHIQRLSAAGRPVPDAAWRLLHRLARSVPGAVDPAGARPDPARVIGAARREAAVDERDDTLERYAAARRAAALTETRRLFGEPPGAA